MLTVKLYISVINHSHDSIIIKNPTLKKLASVHVVIIKSNTPAGAELKNYCKAGNIILLESAGKKGFGANNNEIFSYSKNELGMKNDDLFLVLNPDIVISVTSIDDLIRGINTKNIDIASINLFKDSEYQIYDNSIRHYPNVLSPIRSLFGLKRNDLYDKATITTPTRIEWASGSFLLFKVDTYKKLNGFDEKYFMYFEDADICTRANKEGLNVYFFPSIKGIHYASHQNRLLFSRHFFWYLLSSVKYHCNLPLL